ncbi:DUF6090 family protein [Rasiella sp. SM2506]|uniref:DUF6090 family protein n=1 Tax=Rasiella sp. SM2506 TaxID=3423914 RepID=UPI003D7AD292
MKLLRRFRLKSVPGNGFRKYVLYAIGEIILVVIGILIAVNINNWNEGRKGEAQLNTILKTYKNDMEIDTLGVGQVLRILKEKKNTYKLFLSDTVSKETYVQNPEGFGLVLSLLPFEFQNKGYKMLENYTTSNELEIDSLVIKIVANHAAYKGLIDQTQTRISDDVSENMSYLKNNQYWIGDMLLGKLDNDVMYDYFTGEIYKARLAIHSTLVFGNLEVMLQQWLVYANDILEAITKRLKTS